MRGVTGLCVLYTHLFTWICVICRVVRIRFSYFIRYGVFRDFTAYIVKSAVFPRILHTPKGRISKPICLKLEPRPVMTSPFFMLYSCPHTPRTMHEHKKATKECPTGPWPWGGRLRCRGCKLPHVGYGVQQCPITLMHHVQALSANNKPQAQAEGQLRHGRVRNGQLPCLHTA